MSEPMSEARLAEIEAKQMPLVTPVERIFSAATENALRQEWTGYRNELAAEVRRLRAGIERLTEHGDASVWISEAMYKLLGDES